jgi:hypothetical protein
MNVYRRNGDVVRERLGDIVTMQSSLSPMPRTAPLFMEARRNRSHEDRSKSSWFQFRRSRDDGHRAGSLQRAKR